MYNPISHIHKTGRLINLFSGKSNIVHSEKKNDMGKVGKESGGTLNKDGVKRSNELNFMNDRLKKLERKNEALKSQVSVERQCRKMIRNDVMMAFEEISQLKESIKMMKDSK